MSLPKAFIEAVNNKEIRSIRIMMKNSLLVDPTFKEFNEMNAAISNVPDVYVPHDGKEFILDRSQWDEQYISRIMAQVIGNFSHERVDHLKDVVRYLRPAPKIVSNERTNKIPPQASARRPKSEYRNDNYKSDYQRQKEIDQANGNFCLQKIALGAGIGAVAGAALTTTVSGPIVLGAVGGAVVGAGVIAVATKGER